MRICIEEVDESDIEIDQSKDNEKKVKQPGVITQHTLVNSALTANVLALDRHCSATMFAVFLHCTAVLNCVRATHGLPADRAPVYRGCPCRDPLGCPLTPRQDGVRDKAPTLWLLFCCCNC